MRPAYQVLLGIAPAMLLTVGGLLFAGLISNTNQWLLLACAVLGTGGMIWALVGYAQSAAPVVIAMLLLGICGILWGGGSGAINALVRDAERHQLGSPLGVVLRVLLLSWLILGPTLVGIVHIRSAWQRFRAVA